MGMIGKGGISPNEPLRPELRQVGGATKTAMLYREYGVDKHNNCLCGHKDCQALQKNPIASKWQHTSMWDEEQTGVLPQPIYISKKSPRWRRSWIVAAIAARQKELSARKT